MGPGATLHLRESEVTRWWGCQAGESGDGEVIHVQSRNMGALYILEIRGVEPKRERGEKINVADAQRKQGISMLSSVATGHLGARGQGCVGHQADSKGMG